jgi:D-3-phosphoglycerate dehydrogenase / 2-oxoglutarate reductase
MVALGVTPALLDDLLTACNAVSLHAPLTPATQYLLGQRELDLLPHGSYVVNVSRACLVDGRALLAALTSGRLAGAALDVLSVEPPPPDEPAPRAPRLIVTPHAAWYSPEAEEAVYRRAAEAVRDALAGRRPQGSVNEVVATRSGAS